ncbi:MAG: DUF3006 domain-containing protein [Clostridia bacterium]|nr:DUF3006 domain-containing protein [Clostridia bacterium]
MKYTVDRIEETIAVCEDENGNFVNFYTDKLPSGLREGDIFQIDNGEAVILKEETEERRRLLAEKRKAIINKKRKRVD